MIPLIGLCGAEQASQKLNGSLKRKRADSMKSLTAVNPDDIHDLICVGFGPASLAVAVALQDELTGSVKQKFKPKVCFLEQQPEFRWHAGMLLPEAKMQISFLKDLAMLRNPRSYFTFLNYLKVNGRLVQFTNLGTFLPTRLEFADYMKWCSSAFENVVSYGSSVLDIEPVKSKEDIVKYDLLAVKSRNAEGILTIRRTRNVIIAVGGKPQVHPMLPPNHARVIHSSVYASQIPELLKIRDKAYNIGVLGGGQSAAEVFNDLHSRYLNANTHLIFRDTALRPSDDSPFVNEIFDDERITAFYQRPAAVRQKHINADKSTNYSVVRLELLEKIYRDLYQQRILEPDPSLRKRRLHSSTEVVEVIDVPQNKRINVVLRRINHVGPAKFSRETLSLDVLVYATGYVRDAHNELLAESQVINASNSGQWEVQRDYRVKLDRGFVEEDVNIYLQGCNEASHGLSDSLISVLATRAGEVVGSIFGEKLNELEMNEVNAAAESTNEEEIEPRTSSPG